MARRTLGSLAVVLLILASAACSRELKPDRKGVWAASSGVLVELQPAGLDTEWTDEGFAIPYFSGDPPKVKQGDFYFILYGDYQITDTQETLRRGKVCAHLRYLGLATERHHSLVN